MLTSCLNVARVKKSRNNNDFTVTPPELRAVKAVMCTMWDPTGADPGIFDWGGV